MESVTSRSVSHVLRANAKEVASGVSVAENKWSTRSKIRMK